MNAGGVSLRKTATPRDPSVPWDVSTLRFSGASCQAGFGPAEIERTLRAHFVRPSTKSVYALRWPEKQTERRDRVQSGRTEAHASLAPETASSLRQLRFLGAPKRQVDDALFHFASITVGSSAFILDPVDLVVVAAHIKGRVDNRGNENKCKYRDAYHPHARLPSKYDAGASQHNAAATARQILEAISAGVVTVDSKPPLCTSPLADWELGEWAALAQEMALDS
jgi:hypothetical protein